MYAIRIPVGTHTIYIPKKLLSGIRKNVLSIAFDKNNIPSTIQNTPHLLGGLLKGHGGFLSDELLEDFIINLYYYLYVSGKSDIFFVFSTHIYEWNFLENPVMNFFSSKFLKTMLLSSNM